MPVTINGTTGVTSPGVTDTGNLSVTGTSTLTGAVSQTSSSTATSFIPTGSTVPANGMYLSAANTLNFATNTTSQVSISSGGIVTGTAGNLMLVSGTTQASTSGTSITFTDIPSWAKRVTVLFNNVSTSGTSNIQVQIGSGSVTTTGYLSSSVAANGSIANATTGFLQTQIVVAANNYSGQSTIFAMGSNLYMASGNLVTTNSANNGMNNAGTVTLSGALDRVVITTVNGTDTFDAGSINIQYE